MAVANQIFFFGDHRVDGRNPAAPGTLDVKNPVNNGINNQPQLVSRISSINSLFRFGLRFRRKSKYHGALFFGGTKRR